jgi:hypothetical protein
MSTLLSPPLDIGTLEQSSVQDLIDQASKVKTLEELIDIQNQITIRIYSEKDSKKYSHVRPDWVRTRKVHNQEWIAIEAEIAIFRTKSEARQKFADASKKDKDGNPKQKDIEAIQAIDLLEVEEVSKMSSQSLRLLK